jgi:hypothetical protein
MLEPECTFGTDFWKGRKSMRILKSFGAAVCALATLAVLAIATPAQAQEPHYLQALSDLRTARDYVQFDHRDGFGKQRHDAVDEINKAIDEIKHAAWDDGKNTRFAPPATGVTDPWAPMHQAKNWLDAAVTHVQQGVDTPENQGLRARAFHHIWAAHQIVQGVLNMQGH